MEPRSSDGPATDGPHRVVPPPKSSITATGSPSAGTDPPLPASQLLNADSPAVALDPAAATAAAPEAANALSVTVGAMPGSAGGVPVGSGGSAGWAGDAAARPARQAGDGAVRTLRTPPQAPLSPPPRTPR